MATPVPADDPREELRQLVAALRAHVELLAATGALGVPAGKAASLSTPGVESGPQLFAKALDVVTPPPASSSAPVAAKALPSVAPTGPLAGLAREVAQCTSCQLHSTRTQTVFARGSAASRLCFVGEGPGADEDAQGFPFVGAAGQLLDRMIAAMGYQRDEVYICNIVKCRPPNNRKPEPEEMAACRPFLERQIELLAPSAIVALGSTATQGLLGTTAGITRLRGSWRLYRGQIPVMPTFHPAYLLRNPAAKREVWADLKAVLEFLGRTQPPRP